jgi:hypothetical protein
MSETPVVPVKQANITIGGQSFVAVLLPNGETGLMFPQLSKWLGLKTNVQAQHLRAHPTLSAALVLTLIETPGGPQITNVLLSWGIPLWLARIQPDKRPPLYRERLLVLQRDARAALSQDFFQNPTEEPPPPRREKPSASLEKPSSIRETRQAIRKAREVLAQAEEQWMDLIEQRQQTLEDWLQRPEERPAPARPVEPDMLIGSMPLTVRQHRILVDLLQQLHRRSRVPFETLAAEVADICGVDDLTAISQAAWPEALAWVNHRLGAR